MADQELSPPPAIVKVRFTLDHDFDGKNGLGHPRKAWNFEAKMDGQFHPDTVCWSRRGLGDVYGGVVIAGDGMIDGGGISEWAVFEKTKRPWKDGFQGYDYTRLSPFFLTKRGAIDAALPAHNVARLRGWQKADAEHREREANERRECRADADRECVADLAPGMVKALKAAEGVLAIVQRDARSGSTLSAGADHALDAVRDVLKNVDAALDAVARDFAERDAGRIALDARVRAELGLPPEGAEDATDDRGSE